MRGLLNVPVKRPRGLRALTCFLLFVLLPGCVGRLANIEDGYRFPDETERGLLIGSLTYSGKYAAHQVYLDNTEGERVHRLQTGESAVLFPYFPDGDFGEIGMKGDLFAAELPAGKYTIRWWAVSGGPTVITPTGKFEISFDVRPGEALYIGNFHFKQTSWRGLTVTGAEVQYIDFLERDFDLFRRKYKDVALDRIYTGVEEGLVVDRLGGRADTTWTQPFVYIPVF